MKFTLVENFDGYKKGDKVELSNGQTGTVEADYNLHDDRIKVSIDGMDEIKFPLVDTVRPIYTIVNEDAPSKVTLEVKFEVYGRYGDGGEIITAKVSGKDLRHALMRMCDKMRLYIDSDDIERTNMTAEDILDSISEANGDGCDMIYMLRNLTTNEVLIDCSDCYEEQDWDDDFDESLKEKFNTSSDFPYMFFYNCNNPTFGYDFQTFASSLGARKAYGKYKGTGAGSYFYLVPSEEVYNKLKAVAKDKYTVDMQKLLPYDAESYPNFQYVKESLKETLDMSLEELQRTADRYLDIEIDELMRTILNNTSNMTREQLSRLVRLCRNFYALLEDFASNTIAESLTEDVKTPVELPELKEDVFQDLAKKISEIDENAHKYIYDRLTDFYMPDEPEEDRKQVTEKIFKKLKYLYREMFDFIPYWGGGEEAADNLWDEGVDERITELIGYENFPEEIINDVVIDSGYIIPDND